MSLDCLTACFMLCFCGGYVVRQASLAPLLGAFANGLRGRRTKGKRKGIRARDHAPKSSLPFPLLTPATQAISQTTLLASLRCRVTTPKLYLGVLRHGVARLFRLWAGELVGRNAKLFWCHLGRLFCEWPCSYSSWSSFRTHMLLEFGHTWEGRIIRLHCRNDALNVFSCTKSECVGRCLMFFQACTPTNMRICHCFLRGYLRRLSVYIKYIPSRDYSRVFLKTWLKLPSNMKSKIYC